MGHRWSRGGGCDLRHRDWDQVQDVAHPPTPVYAAVAGMLRHGSQSSDHRLRGRHLTVLAADTKKCSGAADDRKISGSLAYWSSRRRAGPRVLCWGSLQSSTSPRYHSDIGQNSRISICSIAGGDWPKVARFAALSAAHSSSKLFRTRQRGIYVRAEHASSPPHTRSMLTVRIQTIDGTRTFALLDPQPCSAAHHEGPIRPDHALPGYRAHGWPRHHRCSNNSSSWR
jgi:hypothetical protein